MQKFPQSGMERKRKAVFAAHVIDKLFPTDDDDKSTSSDSTRTLEKNVKRNQVHPSKPKVYGVHLPSDVAEQLKAANETVINSQTDDDGADDGTTSDDSNSEQGVSKKPKKKKQRKRNPISKDTEILSGQQYASEMKSAPNQPSSNNPSKQLTKNQKRKLRKKRRRKQQQSNDGATEFTFELEGLDGHQDDDSDSADEDRRPKICSDVKGFIEAIWNVYQRDGAKSTTCSTIWHQATIDTLFLIMEHLDIDTLSLLQHWKQLLILRDAERARQEIENLEKKLAREHFQVLSNLTEYWLTDVIKVSEPT